MRRLQLSKEAFTEMLSGLIQSGVTFIAEEDRTGGILITFTGGF